jgi:hypothetical protein
MISIKSVTLVVLAVLLFRQNVNGGCPGVTKPVTAYTCSSSHAFTFDVLLNGDHTSGAYVWSVQESGVWAEAETNSTGVFNTGTISSTKHYKVVFDLDGFCTDSASFDATFELPPAAPTVHNGVRCGPGGVEVSVDQTSGTTYKWYYNSTLLHTDDDLWTGGPSITIAGNTLQLTLASSSFSGLSVVGSYNTAHCGVLDSGPSSITVTINSLPTLAIGSDQTVCIGASDVTLTGSPSGGTWSGGGVSGSVFHPSTAGGGPHTISYSYTNPTTGCDAVASKVMTVSPNISLNSFTACASNYGVELTATPSGGTWTGSMVSSDGIFAANAAGIGTYSVTYTATVSGCTASSSTTVTVTGGSGPSFTYPIDAPTVCGAGAAHLTVDTGGIIPEDIAYFEWFDSNNTIQRDGGGAIVKDRFLTTSTLMEPTTFTVLAVGFDGCATPQSVTANVIDTTPPLVPDAFNCSDGMGELAVTSYSTAFTYRWKDADDIPIITGAPGLVSYIITGEANHILQLGSIPGTSNLTVYVRKGIGDCYSDYSPATVIYRTLPTVTLDNSNPVVACHTSTSFTLTGGLPSGGSWDVDQNILAGSLFVPQNYAATTHQIGYTYTDEYGCAARAVKSIFVDDPIPVLNQTFTAEYGEPITVSSRMGAPWPYVLAWYPTLVSTTSITTGNSYTTPAVTGTLKYFLASKRTDVDGCEGTRRATFTVNAYPANNYNLVREETILDQGITVDSDIINLPVSEKTMMTSYFDGLGRQMQSVQWSASPTQKDVIQPVGYDLAGREVTKYLPYVASETNGWYKKRALKNTSYNDSDQRTFYETPPTGVAEDSSPFAVTVFDNSGLQRVVEQGSPGSSWQPGTNHTIHKEYLTNGTTEVLLFSYNGLTGELSLPEAPNTYYEPGALLCNKTIDEEQNDVLEYVDKLGRTVCKKVKAPNNTYASTYYVYDDLGNLVIVIPPEGVEGIINGN